MKKALTPVFLLIFLQIAHTQPVFRLIEPGRSAALYHAGHEKVIDTALEMLVSDSRLLGGHPLVIVDKITDNTVIVGIPGNEPALDALITKYKLDISDIEGKWEAYKMHVVRDRNNSYLFILGSDPRGAAYGVLELSRRMGVSPWVWWADVTPARKTEVRVTADGQARAPSVRYRGIFLNDEDWGLMPWATRTLAPRSGKGAIGPEAYAKIFELLLRLRANTIWPAMHECTVPFYLVPGNKEMAARYGIVVGTSHCEPLARNSASEWDVSGTGDYNFITNRENVLDYWAARLQELQDSENIFTIGMRGKHDGMMQGVKTLEEHKAALSRILPAQQALLEKYINPCAEEIPRVFIPYKEVLDVYDAGLDLPEHVTLVWCDDNYGYIRRLSNERERLRAGRSGVYYHVSYWGRPHDYLWLASTSPALIHTEMQRAREQGADRLWILNVGDLKPAEYLTEFFLDLAWDSLPCDDVFHHLHQWAEREFGVQNAAAITPVMKEFYRLSNIRKPEFMGWSRVEEPGYAKGWTPVKEAGYNPLFNNELQRRIDDYLALERKMAGIDIPADKRAAFFQLVEYPVKGASLINQKWLYARLARHHTRDNLALAKEYAVKSLNAHEEIQRITDEYNRLENGKWNRMMDARPRGLPVFGKPEFKELDSLITVGHQPVAPAGETPESPFVVALNAARAENLPGNGTAIEGLGHSFAAVQMRQGSALAFTFDIPAPGDYWIKIATLPNHDADGNGMKIALSVDGKHIQDFDYRVTGRDETWKENVLRGQALSVARHHFREAGKVSLSIRALTSYIILDQVMIGNGNDDFYEFPVNRE